MFHMALFHIGKERHHRIPGIDYILGTLAVSKWGAKGQRRSTPFGRSRVLAQAKVI
jgi:hypothetical protein